MMTDSPDRPADDLDGLTYREAMDELELLLDELEGSEVDVDRLSERVARGVALVRFCRARLDVVADEIDGVVADLASSGSDPGSSESGSGPAPGSSSDESDDD